MRHDYTEYKSPSGGTLTFYTVINIMPFKYLKNF